MKKIIMKISIFIFLAMISCNISLCKEKTLADLKKEAVAVDPRKGATISEFENAKASWWDENIAKSELKNEGNKNPTNSQITEKQLELLNEYIEQEYNSKKDSFPKEFIAYLDAYFKKEEQMLESNEDDDKTIEKEIKDKTPENETEEEKAKRIFDIYYQNWKKNYKNKDFSKLEYEEQLELKQKIRHISNTLSTYLNKIKGQDRDKYEKKYNEVTSSYNESTGAVEQTNQNIIDKAELKVYVAPEKTTDNSDMLSGDGIDKIVEGADEFISTGADNRIDSGKMQSTFSFIYNIFFQIGVGLSVIVGLVLGIKFILSGIEEKAEVKKMLGVYVIACIIIFGSFGIWKLVLNILGSM